MRLFLQYLRGKTGKIAVFFLFAVIFIASFALYHLPLAAVWYPSALCVILGLAVLLLDFRRVKARHETLRLILCQLPTLPDTLPAAHSIPEEAYRALVQALCAQQQALETRMNAQYQDMLDYYTLWAHQIKTPIASMRLQLQQEDTPQARQLLQELSRAEQYVEMVMVYLRLNGGSDLVLRECELDTIVRRAVRRFAGEFIGRKLKLCYEPLNASCVTDEKWLLFVVEQVLSNALKYTRTGSIRVQRPRRPEGQRPRPLSLPDDLQTPRPHHHRIFRSRPRHSHPHRAGAAADTGVIINKPPPPAARCGRGRRLLWRNRIGDTAHGNGRKFVQIDQLGEQPGLLALI